MGGLVLIAAGGTGGHLFPAEALSEALAARGWRVHLATDHRAETYGRAFPAEEIHVIASATLTRSLGGIVGGLLKLARGYLQSRRLVRACARRAIGFGGYPTVPPMLAAAKAGVPTIIHEQNAVIGRANRFLASRVGTIATSVPGVGGDYRSKVVETGNPVRPAVREAGKIAYPVRAADDPFRLLVVGGSQGARFLSDAVPAAVAALPEGARARCMSCSSAGRRISIGCAEAYAAAGVDADLAPFFADLPRRMAASHLVVCRSGASTCRRTCGYRAAGDHGAVAGRARSGSEGQCRACSRKPAAAGWSSRRTRRPERLAGDLAALIDEPGSSRRGGRGRPLHRPSRRCRAARRSRRARRLPSIRPHSSRDARHEQSHEDVARHRAGAFRRHRRHRHERHRRGDGQSRLPRAGLRRDRERQRPAPAHARRRREDRPRRRQPRRGAGGGRLLGDQARQRRSEGGARTAAAGRPTRRDAGRADAAQAGGGDRRYPRQDHDHLDGRGAARCRRLRPDRHQRRHHQRLRHQRAHGRERLDGGRGRRIRRHLRQAAGRRGAGHQHRPGAPRSLRQLRSGMRRLPAVRRERAVLRLRRHVHRPSRRCRR